MYYLCQIDNLNVQYRNEKDQILCNSNENNLKIMMNDFIRLSIIDTYGFLLKCDSTTESYNSKIYLFKSDISPENRVFVNICSVV